MPTLGGVGTYAYSRYKCSSANGGQMQAGDWGEVSRRIYSAKVAHIA